MLRGFGLAVPTRAVIAFGDGLQAVGLSRRADVYWAGRATLTTSPDDAALYDAAFGVFWEQFSTGYTLVTEPPTPSLSLTVDAEPDDEDETLTANADPDNDETHVELTFSAVEVLREKDFALYSPDEIAQADQLIAALDLSPAPRRSQRLTKSQRQTRHHDIRRTVRAALSTGGEIVARHSRRHRATPRRVVFLLDVSGSMEPYARALLRLIHAGVSGRHRVEAFAVGTRLTRLTRHLQVLDPGEAIRQASDEVGDYGGGTRLGSGLQLFNNDWGQRGMSRGAIVVILSDGWDRGDPDELREEMSRLHRAAHRVIWSNPLKVTPGYAPLARGMAAALPHVDDFVNGHSIAALEHLARLIATTASPLPRNGKPTKLGICAT